MPQPRRVSTLEAQLPRYWVPVLGSLYKVILSITQQPTTWVPGLLGNAKNKAENVEMASGEAQATIRFAFLRAET